MGWFDPPSIPLPHLPSFPHLPIDFPNPFKVLNNDFKDWIEKSGAGEVFGAIEKTGLNVGDNFIAGAKFASESLEEGAEEAEKGLVNAGKYASAHACDIALGTGLSSAFVALAADGEEEVSMASMAALAATQFADKSALKSAASVLASILVDPIYLIPGVSDSLGHKDEAKSLITFITIKACSENPKLVVGSAGQFLVGVLISGITSAVCEGKVPGGFTIWKGAQAEITG